MKVMPSDSPPPSILKAPHPRLRRPARPVAAVDDETRALAAAMLRTMRAAGGVGLAAPQIGRSLRLIAAEIPGQTDRPLLLANPKVVSAEGQILWEEGCLSLPGISAPVRRAAKVKVAALDMQGDAVEVSAGDHLAVCLQHEIDHLDGILFVDRLSRLKRSLLMTKYEKLRRKSAREAREAREKQAAWA